MITLGDVGFCAGENAALVTCTERQFSEITGLSCGMVNRLKSYGVIATDINGRQGRILLRRSLLEYRDYLQPSKKPVLARRLASNGFDALLK